VTNTRRPASTQGSATHNCCIPRPLQDPAAQRMQMDPASRTHPTRTAASSRQQRESLHTQTMHRAYKVPQAHTSLPARVARFPRHNRAPTLCRPSAQAEFEQLRAICEHDWMEQDLRDIDLRDFAGTGFQGGKCPPKGLPAPKLNAFILARSWTIHISMRLHNCLTL
jgi:hypothetical protein